MWEDLLSELSKFQLPPERIELVKGVLGVQEIGRRLSLEVRGSRLTKYFDAPQETRPRYIPAPVPRLLERLIHLMPCSAAHCA